jgi:hypothetical protein
MVIAVSFLSKALVLWLCLSVSIFAQNDVTDEKAEAVIRKAVENLGGEKYLQVKTLVGQGKFSIIRDGVNISFQSFVDVIVFPDKERTEFKSGGVKIVQTNYGNEGWIYDGAANTINLQTESQIKDFKRGMKTSLDNLLRGYWRGKASLNYIGRREGTLGRRNDVIRLTYNDGFQVEFEFTSEGLPVKAIYKRINSDGEEVREEDRYAQFVDVGGVKAPFIIDRFSNGMQSSRVNYTSVEYNKQIPDAIFVKPNNPKELKRDLKFQD